MSDSLRDQLLKSGLVQKLRSEARPATPPKSERRPDGGRQGQPKNRGNGNDGRKPAPSAAPSAAPSSAELHERDLARAYALRARAEKEERERAQRELERVAREKRERKQQLAALLEGKAVNANDAELPRHFPHGNKIRRIYCTAEQLPRLNRGELAVVQLAGRYLLVERDIALQVQAIQPECVVLLCDPNAPPEDDVPADLVW
jgi:uncharacterized protein YaiL (DUF2058 family)